MRIFALLAGVVGSLIAYAVQAQPVIISNAEYCGNVDTGLQAGELELTDTVAQGYEYYCKFDALDRFNWDEFSVQTRAGYCMEPGLLVPQVLAFVTDPERPGIIRMIGADGEEQAIEFQVCDMLQQ